MVETKESCEICSTNSVNCIVMGKFFFCSSKCLNKWVEDPKTKFMEQIMQYLKNAERLHEMECNDSHVTVEVKCASCGKEYEDIVEKNRKDFALKNDDFFCSLACAKD